jgi:hypothetical protein
MIVESIDPGSNIELPQSQKAKPVKETREIIKL